MNLEFGSFWGFSGFGLVGWGFFVVWVFFVLGVFGGFGGAFFGSVSVPPKKICANGCGFIEKRSV